MSAARGSRESKRQLGQYFTPETVAARLVAGLHLTPTSRVLEPGFGNGSFILPLIRRFMDLAIGTPTERLETVLSRNVFGVEVDPLAYRACLSRVQQEFGSMPARHNLANVDYLLDVQWAAPPTEGRFTHVVGNPPFGGTIQPSTDKYCERVYGRRGGQKIKKETYSFFIVKALDELTADGRLLFLCSDSLLTINTMKGLRDWMLSKGLVRVSPVKEWSDETQQDIVTIDLDQSKSSSLIVDGCPVAEQLVALTPNHSWRITPALADYFAGETVGDYLVATGGMTTGRNEYFVRRIINGTFEEPYDFVFGERPISLAAVMAKARLGKVSPAVAARVQALETVGAVERFLEVRPKRVPELLRFPHPDYLPYNMATPALLYSPPTHAIYWRNDGDAVLTYKRTGNWYLHGIGGRRFFGREGITWQLISNRLRPRYLPPGSILDSGAPAAFPRPGVSTDELYFVLGWALTDQATALLKGVLNHTRNIQGKDFERLPYPSWVTLEVKRSTVAMVQALVADARRGRVFRRSDPEFDRLEKAYSLGGARDNARRSLSSPDQRVLWATHT